MRKSSHWFLAILCGPALAAAPLRGDDASTHWSFLPIEVPAVPRTGAAHPIDAFIGAELANRNLGPAPEAAPSILLRRVYFDLTGLPPDREQLRAFLDDFETRGYPAYQQVVDRLLESPRHGERWGRHWMDVWRYSDAFGSEGKDRITNALPHLWHWRDWIVESLNEDKGLDQMILEMLAGDEIAPSDPKALRATGFLVRNRYRLDRNVPLTASVEHTARAFLALTFECARCHEHKYDPITHQDYYAFRAFFEPIGFRTDRLPGQPDLSIDGLPRVYDADLAAATYLFEKGDERRPDKENPLPARLPAFFEALLPDGEPFSIAEISIPPEEANPFLKPWVADEEAGRLEGEISRLQSKLTKAPDDALSARQLDTARARLSATRAVQAADNLKQGGASNVKIEAAARTASEAQRLLAIATASENIVAAKVTADGFREQLKTDPSKKAQLEAAEKEVAKSEAEFAKAESSEPGTGYAPLGEVYPAKSTGRRAALAGWLISKNNPLTARVAVNHIWMRHFGEPLVPTVFDFGMAGQPPTHPELLDWLAAEFINSGWSMKRLHRLIVTSDAYRRSSSNSGLEANFAADPGNRYLWRMHSRRMEAEAVRDSLLHLANLLDPAVGGPEIPVDNPDKSFRRSLYFKHSGVDVAPILADFDSASVIECYRRRESIVPQQALTLSNSPLAQQSARRIAADLTESSDGSPEFITAAFEAVLTRAPRASEVSECAAFLEEQAALLADPGELTRFEAGPKADPPPASDPLQRARENLVHVLLNHNDYVTIR